MTYVAYQWSGETFCEEDIVSVLTDYEPWSAWVEAGNEPREGQAETDLNEIAVMFGINRRSKADIARHKFPVRLRGTPDPPTYCSSCLKWFS